MLMLERKDERMSPGCLSVIKLPSEPALANLENSSNWEWRSGCRQPEHGGGGGGGAVSGAGNFILT